MKELNILQMEEVNGGAWQNCAMAGMWGIAAICGGILGGPAGVGVGWLAVGMGVGYLSQC